MTPGGGLVNHNAIVANANCIELCRDHIRSKKVGAEGQSQTVLGNLVTVHNEIGHGR